MTLYILKYKNSSMKKFFRAAVFFVAVFMIFACGCVGDCAPSNGGKPHQSAYGIADKSTPQSDKIADFANNKTGGFKASQGEISGEPFGCRWEEENAKVNNGALKLSVTLSGGSYKSADYRSPSKYSYGYYSAKLKAAKCSGVVTAFSTFTCEPYRNEINFEIPGNAPDKVRINYYADGIGGHEYEHKLGFDASKGFHEYGFDWQEDYIVWYVDGKAVYKAVTEIPSSPAAIMADVRNGQGTSFKLQCGELKNSDLPANAEFSWIGCSASPVKEEGGGNAGGDKPVPPENPGGNEGGDKPVTPENPGGNEGGDKPDKPENPEKPTEPVTPIGPDMSTQEGDKLIDFKNGHSGNFEIANWTNGNMFNCYWRPNNINFNTGNGTMDITLTRDYSNETGFAGGEYRTWQKYGFGYYSVCMKPAKCVGTVSSFFTYTNQPRWDEIDIEFLGKDTTKVQFNYYTNGVAGHEYLYDLGFDASKEFHEYGFLWKTDSIIWYVDGKAVYKATKDIPQYPSQIMVNLWNGKGVDDWLGVFNPDLLPVTAQYKWMAFKAV